MIPEQTITMTWTNSIKKYYMEKGYNFTGLGTSFKVNIKDLSPKSGKKIKVICDYCHKPFYPYNSNFARNPHPPHCCNNCKHQKAKDTCQRLYNVDNPTQLKSVQEKIKITNQKRYGCDNPSQNEKVKEKIKNNNITKYGVPCTLQEKNTNEKRNKTMISKYGNIHALQNHEILNKALNKRAKTLEGTELFSSPYQDHLNEILHGKKNVACERYLIDILVDNFAIEYDGGGHCLDLKFKIITQEEYNEKQARRNQILWNHGYKIINIRNPYDLKIDDDFIIEEIHKAMKLNQDFTIIEIK